MRFTCFVRTTAVVTTALLAAACSSGTPEEEPTPRMPETSTTTATPTPEPEAWEVRSRAGVEAYLERYVELLSNAMRTGDTASLLELTQECDECRELADQIDAVYAADGRIETEPKQFKGWSLGESGITKDNTVATVRYQSPPATWIRQSGGTPETYPGGLDEQGISLRWTGDSWRVTSIFGVG